MEPAAFIALGISLAIFVSLAWGAAFVCAGIGLLLWQRRRQGR